MTSPVLLLYATHHGHTKKIVRHIRQTLSNHNVPTLPFDLSKETPAPHVLEKIPLVCAIAPIRYGFHLRQVTRFLIQNKQIISTCPLVLASINLTARKPEKNTPKTNPYFIKWVKRDKLNPILAAVFGGELNYTKYPFWDRWAIRLIMTITGGPTHFDTHVDYTDWNHVANFAADIAVLYHHIEESE